MNLKDKINPVGHFSIKSYNKDGTVTELTEKNLIMDTARINMAELLGGSSLSGDPINKFVIGTEGHVNGDILVSKQVGSDGFDSTRSDLFSEEDLTKFSYAITFDPYGEADVTVDSEGIMYQGNTQMLVDPLPNTIRRLVSDRTVTYTITIPSSNGNSLDPDSVIAYTEAALYSGTNIFSMKCFSARVKEETVKLEIIWSIVF